MQKTAPRSLGLVAEGTNTAAQFDRSLRDRLAQAGQEGAGQRRNVTILFADISGYTALAREMGDEEVYHLLRQVLQQLAGDVYRYEGIVDKFTGDGLMAIFGAPIAYENNAERAVRAALDMQVGIAQLRGFLVSEYDFALQMRVGLHSGSVIIGGVGTDTFMDYTAIGDTVNLASGLEHTADPGTILISDAVYRQTRMLADFGPATPLQLKGYAEPVTTYLVNGLLPEPGSVRGLEGLYAPIIGRDLELDQLKRAVSNLVEDRRGQVILLIGEAGIGKSRLTREMRSFVHQHYRDRLLVIDGQSLTYRRSMSYWLLQEVLRSYLGLTASTPDDKIRTALRQRVQESLGSMSKDALPFLEYVLGLDLSDTEAAERIQFLEASQLRRQILFSIRDLLAAEAGLKPVLLILGDLHWADEASLDLIRFLLDIVRQVPIMIYGISRTFQSGTLEGIREHARTQMQDRYVEIVLRSLPRLQSEMLLQHLLTLTELPEGFQNHIVERAGGVPFYLEEILRMLIQNGQIQYQEGRWQIASQEISEIGVPETLEDLILAHFDRLNRMQRRVLQVASIIPGRNISLPLLQAVLH